MAAKDVAAVGGFSFFSLFIFSAGLFSIAPLPIGVVGYQREASAQAWRRALGFDLDGFVTVGMKDSG